MHANSQTNALEETQLLVTSLPIWLSYHLLLLVQGKSGSLIAPPPHSLSTMGCVIRSTWQFLKHFSVCGNQLSDHRERQGWNKQATVAVYWSLALFLLCVWFGCDEQGDSGERLSLSLPPDSLTDGKCFLAITVLVWLFWRMGQPALWPGVRGSTKK